MLPTACNTQVTHPLLADSGVSQPERFLPAVDPTRIQIDDRGLPELLGFILRLSKRITFYPTEIDPTTNQPFMQPRSWLKFFENSQPFLLASISQTDLTAIEQAYEKRLEEVRNDPSLEGFQLWMAYSHSELIKLILTWHNRLQERDTSLKTNINMVIINELRDHLKEYIALLNGTDRWYCTGRYSDDFTGLANPASVWGLEFIDLYATDESFRAVSNPDERIRLLANQFDAVFRVFLRVGRQWLTLLPDAFAKSLLPLQQEYQQTHAPHLGLLFTFLELFNLFRNDLNSISQKHLEYFYQNVLRIKPLPATPDSVHLILETARTVDKPYAVKKGTPLLAGKDDNSTDIRFETDDEIVVDKAQVKEVRTLYLNPVQVGEKTFVENVYMAPMANSLDGVKTPFPDPKAVQWPTLGRKESPLRLPNQDHAELYPYARLGWIFASPVLLLNEGKRTVTITINGTFDQTKNTALAAVNLQRVIANSEMIADALMVSFSGKEGWVLLPPSNPVTTITAQPSGITITITTVLDERMPPITFFYKDAWKIKENEHRPDAPSVRIILNPTAFIEETEAKADLDNDNPDCDLQAPLSRLGKVSLYYYLRGLRIIKTAIKVEVCGVKNLIVQNDENLQDVNSPVYPFSPRPNIPDFSIINTLEPIPQVKIEGDKVKKADTIPFTGPNFYIGSQEIFLKNWQEAVVNICWKDKPSNLDKYYEAYGFPGLNPVDKSFENNFGLRIGALANKRWFNEPNQRKLFRNEGTIDLSCRGTLSCSDQQVFPVKRADIRNDLAVADIEEFKKPFTELTVDTSFGFLRFTLENQDFLHKDYPIILARQMMALGKYPSEFILNATYLRRTDGVVFSFIHPFDKVQPVEDALKDVKDSADQTVDETGETITLIDAITVPDTPADLDIPTLQGQKDAALQQAQDSENQAKNTQENVATLDEALHGFFDFIGEINQWRQDPRSVKVAIPNEPYTPIIKEISVDYTAVTSSADKDFEFMHLYPYDGTYKVENLVLEPMLLPTFTDEGTLYIGLSDLRPNGTLNLLFQLAEITADSELDKVDVKWSYLVDNDWKELLPLTNILKDGTDGLTRSGIVKMALPHDIPVGISDNTPDKTTTVMPPNRYWLRASVGCNARATANTVGVHTQAVKVTFVSLPANDTNRLTKALPAESITKLLEADSSISAVQQPYASGGGKPAEQHNNLYRRIGEQLRHKGRAVALFDYERLTLEAFPGLFRAKCISHTLGLPASLQVSCPPARAQSPINNEAPGLCKSGPFEKDLEIAPGFVLLGVIPNVVQLETADRYEPRVPAGVLNDIEAFLKKRTSPFVQLKAMNPRYERVEVDIKVSLYNGLDRTFYEAKLKEDIRLFLSPWVTGDLTRLAFGLSIKYADVIQFIEKLVYVDFIINLTLAHEGKDALPQLNPQTARSILTAGTITVAI